MGAEHVVLSEAAVTAFLCCVHAPCSLPCFVLGWRWRCGAARTVCLVVGWRFATGGQRLVGLSLANSRGSVRAICGWGDMRVQVFPPLQLVMHRICPCLVHGCWSRLGTGRLLLQCALMFRPVGTPPVSLFVAHLCVYICLQRVSFGPHSTPPRINSTVAMACVPVPPVNCRSCVVCWGYCTPIHGPVNMRCAFFVLYFLSAVLAALMLQAAGGPGEWLFLVGAFLTVCQRGFVLRARQSCCFTVLSACATRHGDCVSVARWPCVIFCGSASHAGSGRFGNCLVLVTVLPQLGQACPLCLLQVRQAACRSRRGLECQVVVGANDPGRYLDKHEKLGDSACLLPVSIFLNQADLRVDLCFPRRWFGGMFGRPGTRA